MLNCVAALSLREAARRSILPSPVPVPFPLLPPGRTRIIPKETLNEKKEKQKNRKKENTKARKPKKRDYSRSQSVQKSARFSFRVVWFVHAPVTHPTLQPPLTVSIIFLFISVFLLIFPLLIFSLSLSFSSPTCVCVDNSPTLVHCDARIVFLLCTHIPFFLIIMYLFFLIDFTLTQISGITN